MFTLYEYIFPRMLTNFARTLRRILAVMSVHYSNRIVFQNRKLSTEYLSRLSRFTSALSPSNACGPERGIIAQNETFHISNGNRA